MTQVTKFRVVDINHSAIKSIIAENFGRELNSIKIKLKHFYYTSSLEVALSKK